MSTKTTIWMMVITIILIASWYFAARQPDIKVEMVDHINKSFTVRIGLKKYTWKMSDGSLNIPRVNIGYSAVIQALTPQSAIVKIERYDETVKQLIVKFN